MSAPRYSLAVQSPPDDSRWVALSDEPLPVGAVADWAIVPACGAVVMFSGTARDHAEGRAGVSRLTYEAYEEQAVPRLHDVADQVFARWPDVGRVALLHRTGDLAVGDTAVVVAVSTPHRAEAFEAARYAIDAVKASVPIWKKETWHDGSTWGLGAAAPVAAAEVEAVRT